ncbi:MULTISPECIES: ErpL protein [Borreliella]|uniref:ErpL protein n=1 Tax=Borreliella TaxID=64895 RepID=UPI001AED4C88|nr:ErpL protein [Borreliella valaisiana]WVN14758.1 ErpL protein [Borreliella valaisiana]
MNKKIRMFIICSVFALIISCKNYASNKDLKSLEQSSESSDSKLSKSEQELKKQVKGFLDILDTKDLSNFNEQDAKEIEKTIEDLKDKIEKTDAKKTLIGTYLEYGKTVKEIREKLKDNKNFENKLKEFEESLKNKKEERKQKLEEAKKKFAEFKVQVGSASGVTQGEQVRGQGIVGQQAFNCAKEFGLTISLSNSIDTRDMSKGIVDGAIKQIDEELKKVE